MFVYLGGNKLNIPDQYVNNIKHRDRYTTQYETEFYDGRRVINTINPKFKTFPISVLLKDNLAQGRELLNDFQGSETTLQIGYYKNVESFDSGTFIKSGSGTVASGYTKHTEGSGSLYIDHSGSATMNIYRGFPTPISTEVSGEDLMICFDFDISGSVGGSDTNFSGTIKIKTDNSNLLYCNFTQADCQYKKNEWYHIVKQAQVSGSPTYTNLISGEINLSGLNTAGTDIYFDNLRFQDTQEVYIYEGYVLSKQTNEEEHWTISTESNTYSFADKNGFALDPWNFVQLFSGSGVPNVSLTNFTIPSPQNVFSGLNVSLLTPTTQYNGFDISNDTQTLIYSGASGTTFGSGTTFNISKSLDFLVNGVNKNYSGNIPYTFTRNSQMNIAFNVSGYSTQSTDINYLNGYEYITTLSTSNYYQSFTAINNSASGGGGMYSLALLNEIVVFTGTELASSYVEIYSDNSNSPNTLITGGTSNIRYVAGGYSTSNVTYYFPYNPTLSSGTKYWIKLVNSGHSFSSFTWGKSFTSYAGGDARVDSTNQSFDFGFATGYRSTSGVFNYSGNLILKTGR